MEVSSGSARAFDGVSHLRMRSLGGRARVCVDCGEAASHQRIQYGRMGVYCADHVWPDNTDACVVRELPDPICTHREWRVVE